MMKHQDKTITSWILMQTLFPGESLQVTAATAEYTKGLQQLILHW